MLTSSKFKRSWVRSQDHAIIFAAGAQLFSDGFSRLYSAVPEGRLLKTSFQPSSEIC
jgi:hypothetical protein